VYDSMVPWAAFVDIGISAQETIPASVSKDIEPSSRFEIEVTPVERSYLRAPEPTSKPPAKVEVAVVDVATMNGAFKYDHAEMPRARISPLNVVVPVPEYVVLPLTVKFPTVNVPILPVVEKRLVEDAVVEKSAVVVAAVADNVWSVTRPVFDIEKRVVVADWVEDAIKKRLVLVSPLFAKRESLARGDVVPMPTLPVVSILRLSVGAALPR